MYEMLKTRAFSDLAKDVLESIFYHKSLSYALN